MTYKMTVIGIYAPVEGKYIETTEFYDEIQEVIDKANKKDHLIIAGDFNARIGNQPVGGCIGSGGEPTTNNNGRLLTDFCIFNNLKITHSFFRHKNIHRHTWEARGLKSVIDYIIVDEKLKPDIRDT
jgi:endonuclease/exonuclease/phosphatase family metal-dependent hydrolase